MVPSGVVKLYEADVALGKASGEKAIRGKCAGLSSLFPVKLEDGRRFVRNVQDLRDGSLHAVGHLVLGHTSVDLGITQVLVLQGVKFGQAIQHFAPILAGDAVGILEKENG